MRIIVSFSSKRKKIHPKTSWRSMFLEKICDVKSTFNTLKHVGACVVL